MTSPATPQSTATPVPSRHAMVRRIVNAFPSAILRMYCRIRFLIIGPRFLDPIDRYLPEQGDVLDIGAGFGVVALYFSSLHPSRFVHGFELEQRRVDTARAAATALAVPNVQFVQGDAAEMALAEQYDAAYVIDVIHHLPREAVPAFLAKIHAGLKPGGRFLVKEVDNTPAYKRWFSLLTDRVMGGYDVLVYYWPVAELRAALSQAGFRVEVQRMPDLPPYPHVLYSCEKDAGGARVTSS